MTYIALLRGINVGTSKRIKMADLRTLLTDIGLGRVETYIQSGNVLFESDDAEDLLGQRLEQAMAKSFGFSVSVVLRSAEELDRLIRDCPFSEQEIAEHEADAEGDSCYVLLLHRPLDADILARLNAVPLDGDIWKAGRREIYLLFNQSVRVSRLARQLDKVAVPGTMRNWRTINALNELAADRRN